MRKINNQILYYIIVVILLSITLVWVISIIKKNKTEFTYSPYDSIGVGDETTNSIIDTVDNNNRELQKLLEEYNKLELEEIKTKSVNIAIIGSDERESENSRSDILMVIQFDPLKQKFIMISVPRDTRVEIPGFHTDKINHAYAYGGAELSVDTLEKLFNTSIDYYIKISFEDFKNIIDSLGGVEINAFKDFDDGKNVIVTQGQNVLNGNQALFYVRYRGDSEGDFGRIKRQQEVIQSLSTKIHNYDKNTALLILFKLYSESIEMNMDFSELMAYYKLFNTLDTYDVDTYTLKTDSSLINNLWYEIYEKEDLANLSTILNNNVQEGVYNGE